MRALIILLVLAVPALATEHLDPRPVRVLTGAAAAPWDRVELLRDRHPQLKREPFLRSTRPVDLVGEGVVDAFGTDTPSGGDVLLHYAAGWERPQHPTPVILVHGTGSNASHSFGWPAAGSYAASAGGPSPADAAPPPALRQGSSGWPDRARSAGRAAGGAPAMPAVPPAVAGAHDPHAAWPRDGHGELARTLAARGHAVFAVSFAAPYGCNFMQREMLADAIERVRAVTRARQVDLVGHSKGAVVARMLVSDVRRPWGAPFARQVRRTVLVASPNRGIDFTFRHPNSATFVFPALGAAFAGPRDLTYMVDLDGSRGLFGGAHEGVLQITEDLHREHPYSLLEVDGIASRAGGWGTLGHYPGIEKAIARSGRLIALLERAGVDPAVELAVLAGTRREFDHEGHVIPGEMDGPSDGLVLEVSATATGGLTRRGATLRRLERLPLNHGELVWKPAAMRWIARQLE